MNLLTGLIEFNFIDTEFTDPNSHLMIRNSILWADDDTDDLQMMREILDKYNRNFDIIEVGNGHEAIQYLEKQPDEHLPRLIILDINMPILDGKETLTLIKRNQRFVHIPVVIFTTSESELDKLFCKKMGAEMVSKPPSFGHFENAIVRILESHRL